jgi:hypothetical protein
MASTGVGRSRGAMSTELTLELGKPGIHEDPADSGMVIVDFPLSETADPQWMSIFSARVAQSIAQAWTVTGESIRLRSATRPEALRADIAVLRQVVAATNAAYNGSGEDEPLTALQQVIDDEFDRR